MDDNEFDEKEMNEEQPDSNETPDGYEVGYGKPPKRTRFQKGTSGNPSGRPKKALDFDVALLREARSAIAINENGRQVRIPKHDVIVKQLVNNAIKGKTSELRMFREAYREAFQKQAQSEADDVNELESLSPEELTTDELQFLVLGGDPQVILRRRKLERERKNRKTN